ncbi:MAG: 50S ribosomal protein L25/general stress protein Ctc [Bacteroidales bacterium]|jgi:large subunit ribosomal protein L25|nr:50S ribosomal protein L25/general stress protein Ctc [Bacteroidales bacterium]
MKHFEVNANLRTDLGKKATKKVRKDENIPCVIYGGEENVHFYTSQSAVRKLIYTPDVMFADIIIDGKKHVSIVKDIQFHPVSDKILHIDFYEVKTDKPIKIGIPMKVTGSSPGVKAGGKLKQNVRKINVKGLMDDIPEYFNVDISNLRIGQSIRIKDLSSDILEFTDPKNSVVMMVASARGVAVAEEGSEDESEESAE